MQFRPNLLPASFFPSSSRNISQRGAVALAVMMLIGLVAGVMVIGYAQSVRGSNHAVDPRTMLALAQAREALAGYAATYRDTHPNQVFGFLPCPDLGTGTEGEAATACGSRDVTVIGRLPWKTLDLPPLRDAGGECLWYAVSGNYKNNPKTRDMLNRDTNGLIEVMAADGSAYIAGASPTERAVAVIFAPGPILGNQNRSPDPTKPSPVCGGNYNAANYLDTDAASGIDNATPESTANDLSTYIAAVHSDVTSSTSDAFNDQLMTVLPRDIWQRLVERRNDFESYLTDPLTGLLRKSADCLLTYARTNDRGVDGKYLPWAARLTNISDGLNFDSTEDYLSGRLPFDVSTSANSDYDTHNNDNYHSTPLLSTAMCPGWGSVDEFWGQWKDHMFYALAKGVEVRYHEGHSDDPCDDAECLRVENPSPEGTLTNVAGVVLFAGEKLSGQNRNNRPNPDYRSDDKNSPANYLEGKNRIAIATNPGSRSDPDRVFSKTTGNDSMMCLVYDWVGSDTEIFLDPTCGTSARCESDGDLLAAFRAGSSNNCKVGNSGVSGTCQVYANRIATNNCPGDASFPTASNPVSCKRAARDFLSYECLQGIASERCTNAHEALTRC